MTTEIQIDDIKKDYPKTYKLLVETMGEDKEDMTQLALMHAPRFLYDFFDKQNIIININYSTGEDFWFDIISGTNEDYEGVYTTREEAEQQAFMKAFSIKETQL